MNEQATYRIFATYKERLVPIIAAILMLLVIRIESLLKGIEGFDVRVIATTIYENTMPLALIISAEEGMDVETGLTQEEYEYLVNWLTIKASENGVVIVPDSVILVRKYSGEVMGLAIGAGVSRPGNAFAFIHATARGSIFVEYQ